MSAKPVQNWRRFGWPYRKRRRNFVNPSGRSKPARAVVGPGATRVFAQTSLSVAHDTRNRDPGFGARGGYTAVQRKAIVHPTEARPMHRALEKLVALPKRNGVTLRQSYRRAAERAPIMVGVIPTPTSSNVLRWELKCKSLDFTWRSGLNNLTVCAEAFGAVVMLLGCWRAGVNLDQHRVVDGIAERVRSRIKVRRVPVAR